MKTKLLIFQLLITFFLAQGIFAQDNGTEKPGTTGTISGTVQDRDTKQPITGAAVTLYHQNDSSLVTGAETDNTGKFTLQNVPAGTYRLEVNLVGYNTAVANGVVVTAGNTNLKPITLKSGMTTTEEIQVESEVPFVQIEPDKKIYNIEQSMVTRGASATDALRNIPGIEVDADGNVSLRGSEGVRILINGRPMGLDGPSRTTILQQISADDIERIELITNPSAKYEAEGSSGIVNIILKKNTELGYNGTLNLNAGTNDAYNGALSFNLRNDKYNFTANYSYRLFDRDLTNSSTRQSSFNNTTSFYDVNSTGNFRRENHRAKLGLDLYLDKNNILGLSAQYNNRGGTRNQNSNNTYTDANGNLTSQFIRDLTSDDGGYELDLGLNYEKKFKDPKQTLTGEVNYSRSVDDDNDLTLRNYTFPTGTPQDNLRETTHGKDYDINAQLDYVQPIGKDSRIEAGLRGRIKEDDSDYLNEYFDTNTNQYVTDPSLSRNFIFDQNIYSAYTTFTSKIKDFGYQLGLRGEYTMDNGDVTTTGQTFERNYFSLFPSVSLSQKLSETDQLQATYSRRVRRPRSGNLNPFISASDQFNLSQGNINLQPEYTDSYELNYIKYLNSVTITPSLFYRRSTDEITRVRTLIDTNTTLTTFDNINNSKTYGGEMLVNANLFKIWNTNASFSYFRTDVSGSTLLQTQDNSAYSWSARLMSNLRLPNIANMQVMYFYSGERVTPQAIIDPFSSVDVALNKDLFDGKANVGFRVSDLFNTGHFNIRFKDNAFVETSNQSINNRNFFFTFTYRFGETSKDRNKNRDNQNDDNSGDTDFGF